MTGLARAVRWGAAALLWLAAIPLSATCLPVEAVNLQALDSSLGRDPVAAVREANRRLAATADPWLQAQLYAIVAEAWAARNQAAESHAAVLEVLRRLDALPLTPAARRLRLRAAQTDFLSAGSEARFTEAIASLDALLDGTGPRSLERSCALGTRAVARAQMVQLEAAAADGITAYRIAEEGGFTEARMEAAYALSTIYRGAGLYHEAGRMIDEVLAFAQREGRTALVTIALWTRATTLEEAGEHAAARQAAQAALAQARTTGDAAIELFARETLCRVDLAQSRLDDAQHSCGDDAGRWRATGRRDFILRTEALRARVDLRRGQPAAALARLDAIVKEDLGRQVPQMEADIHRDRAGALAALGRYREATAELESAFQRDDALDLDTQSRAVAVLTSRYEAERLLANNRLLEARMGRQRAELREQQSGRLVWEVVAGAAILIAALLAFLLRALRRRERQLRRQELVLRTTSQFAPDALWLLDTRRRIRFANRALFGEGDAPREGQQLVDCLPPGVGVEVAATLAAIFSERQAVSRSLSLEADGGPPRQFELRGVPVIEAGELVGATLRAIDVTDLRALEREVIDVSHRERRRLSTDLHEGLGQELAGISMLLQGLKRAVEKRMPDLSTVVGEINAQLTAVIDATRELARGFSPVQTERGSLGAALERFAADATRRLGVPVGSKCTVPDDAIPEAAADHLYRIVREAVDNAARHAGGTRIDIEVGQLGSRLTVAVRDDGMGFAPGNAQHEGLGLRTMAYRARLIGASFRVESRRGGSGTRVVVSVPLEANES